MSFSFVLYRLALRPKISSYPSSSFLRLLIFIFFWPAFFSGLEFSHIFSFFFFLFEGNEFSSYLGQFLAEYPNFAQLLIYLKTHHFFMRLMVFLISESFCKIQHFLVFQPVSDPNITLSADQFFSHIPIKPISSLKHRAKFVYVTIIIILFYIFILPF